MSNFVFPERLRSKNLDNVFGSVRSPRTPFDIYYMDEKVKVREQFPGLPYKQVKAEVTKRWNALGDQSQYISLSTIDRIRYEQERKIKDINLKSYNEKIDFFSYKAEVETWVHELRNSSKMVDHLQASIMMKMVNTMSVDQIREVYNSYSKAPVDIQKIHEFYKNIIMNLNV